MSVEQVLNLAERADKLCERPGLEGWGLWVADDLVGFGEVVDLAPAHGCTDLMCGHVTHDVAAPDRKWVPPDGWRLVVLHQTGTYVLAAVVGPDWVQARNREVRWVQVVQADFAHHAHVEYVKAEDVPQWAVVHLGKRLRTEGLL